VCVLIGCTRDQLEDREFKEKELGEEWWVYKLSLHNGAGGFTYELKDYLTHQEYSNPKHLLLLEVHECYVELIKMTPRLLLQFIGTDLFRNQLHPNTWVNATMAEYKLYDYALARNGTKEIKNIQKYPNWIISDVRFPNEVEAIKKAGGFVIRIERDVEKFDHFSETALDDYDDFKFVMENSGDIEALTKMWKKILLLEDLIHETSSSF